MQNVIQKDRYSAGVILLLSAALPNICLLGKWSVIFIPLQLEFFPVP